MDWASAEAEAVAHGGHLITIGRQQEQEFVVATFLSPPDKVYWIGMTDAEKEGDWHWISGEPITFTNWENPGEPNNVNWCQADHRPMRDGEVVGPFVGAGVEYVHPLPGLRVNTRQIQTLEGVAAVTRVSQPRRIVVTLVHVLHRDNVLYVKGDEWR